MQALVGIMIGSGSYLPLMKAAAVLESFEIPFEINVLSVHRTSGKE
jgi:phosphoribosylcarboxyaminoimidazole (NCAIR) mutase